MSMLMLTTGQRDLVRDKGTILGRALIGLLFLVSGIGMLMDPALAAGRMMAVGVPLASLSVWLVIALKIAAGGAIIIGKRVGMAAAALIAFTALATLLGHLNPFDITAILKNLAIIGGLLYLMAYGPGGSNTRLNP